MVTKEVPFRVHRLSYCPDDALLLCASGEQYFRTLTLVRRVFVSR